MNLHAPQHARDEVNQHVQIWHSSRIPMLLDEPPQVGHLVDRPHTLLGSPALRPGEPAGGEHTCLLRICLSETDTPRLQCLQAQQRLS